MFKQHFTNDGKLVLLEICLWLLIFRRVPKYICKCISIELFEPDWDFTLFHLQLQYYACLYNCIIYYLFGSILQVQEIKGNRARIVKLETNKIFCENEKIFLSRYSSLSHIMVQSLGNLYWRNTNTYNRKII
jgi:hypothetical protein